MTFVFREDGYFNMTKAAAHFGKRIDHFLENAETYDYIEAISELIPGIPVITAKRGYHTHPSVGTFAHPKLAVFFARWLDVKFAVWCDMMIEDILTKKAEVTIVKPQESAVLQTGYRVTFGGRTTGHGGKGDTLGGNRAFLEVSGQ